MHINGAEQEKVAGLLLKAQFLGRQLP
jgi:hypothetical protein